MQTIRVRDAAQSLRVSERTIWRLLADGTLPRVKVRGCTRIPVNALEGFDA